MATPILTAARLRELLHYDQQTGIFTRLVRTSNRITIGDVAGARRPDGYLKISLGNKSYLAHRLAWLYVYGEWPAQEIDHRDSDRTNNRLENLRDVHGYENQQNQKVAHITNKSCGMLGASWDARKMKWVAQISRRWKRTHIGYFSTPEEAHQAYLRAKRRIHEACTI